MTKTYNYKYPHPAVTTDIVAFTVKDEALSLLLVRRKNDPFKDCWALPGGFLDENETLDECAARELQEETGLGGLYLEQLYSFSAPERDPRERVISVAYFTLVPSDAVALTAGDDALEARWFAVAELPELAFDHPEIIEMAQKRLSAKMEYSTIGFQFMAEEFTLSQLQTVYEEAIGRMLDKRNFRKWILSLNLIEETGKKYARGAHRPAMLYRLTAPGQVAIIR